MADSNITKKALAAAMKELLNEMSFEKISVANICEKCDMNRKSFYYHFKDKYDLVNWIFDVEMTGLIRQRDDDASYEERWEFIERACDYFYENRTFYRRALQIHGQNCFADHFREYIAPLLYIRLQRIYENRNIDDFAINFYADAMLCAINRWLSEKDCIKSSEFVEKVKNLIENSAMVIQEDMQ